MIVTAEVATTNLMGGKTLDGVQQFSCGQLSQMALSASRRWITWNFDSREGVAGRSLSAHVIESGNECRLVVQGELWAHGLRWIKEQGETPVYLVPSVRVPGWELLEFGLTTRPLDKTLTPISREVAA